LLALLAYNTTAFVASAAKATPARFVYEACDSALPGGGLSGATFTVNPGVPFTPFNNCASPGGTIGIVETGTTSATFAWWSVPIAAPPKGYVESVTVTGSPCNLGPANDHTFVYQNDPPWPQNKCADETRVYHAHSNYSPFSSGGGFVIMINCDGAVGPCGQGPVVGGHYFAAIEVDDNAPTVSALHGPLLGTGPLRGHQSLEADLADVGGGVAEAAVLVNGSRTGPTMKSKCDLVTAKNPSYTGTAAIAPTPCPKTASAQWSLDTQAYPFHDGLNSVQVCAYDYSTLNEPNAGCSDPALVEVDNSCTGSPIGGGEVLSADFAKSKKDTVTVSGGKGAELSGGLANDAGDPIRGATICVKAETLGVDSEAATVGAVRTDARGEYTYKVPPGPNRRIVVGYRHDAKQVARDLRFYAKARPSLRAAPAALANGKTVHLWGRLPGPRAGHRVVVIQANAPGSPRWITFRRATTKGGGSFHSSYRFSSTTRRTRYRFRALVPEQAGYPWVEGHSKPVPVLVRG
jgi:hypothetical protein